MEAGKKDIQKLAYVDFDRDGRFTYFRTRMDKIGLTIVSNRLAGSDQQVSLNNLLRDQSVSDQRVWGIAVYGSRNSVSRFMREGISVNQNEIDELYKIDSPMMLGICRPREGFCGCSHTIYLVLWPGNDVL